MLLASIKRSQVLCACIIGRTPNSILGVCKAIHHRFKGLEMQNYFKELRKDQGTLCATKHLDILLCSGGKALRGQSSCSSSRPRCWHQTLASSKWWWFLRNAQCKNCGIVEAFTEISKGSAEARQHAGGSVPASSQQDNASSCESEAAASEETLGRKMYQQWAMLDEQMACREHSQLREWPCWLQPAVLKGQRAELPKLGLGGQHPTSHYRCHRGWAWRFKI